MEINGSRARGLNNRGGVLMPVLLVFALAGLAFLFVAFVRPIKSVDLPIPLAASPNAKAATEHFWSVFHGDRYEEIPAVLDKLNKGYDGDKQPVMTNLLGAAHLWRFQERRRVGRTAPEMREDLVRAAAYADRTLAVDPNDTFAPAIRVTSRWQLAVLDGKPDELAAIELEILDNTQKYPQFHAFVQGWLLSAMLAPDSPRYGEAQAGFKLLADSCAGFTTPPNTRFNGLVFAYLAIKAWATVHLCYNNPVAPHNLESTFLSTGDMMVKMGQFDQARIWYGNAQASPTYATWRYRGVVEERLASDFKVLQTKYVADSGKLDVADPALSFQSTMGCANCHAQ